MEFEIVKMTPEDKQAVIDMMRVFYASDAVMSNGTDEIFENDVNICTSGSPYAEGYVFKDKYEYLGYAMIAKSYSTEFGKRCIWIEDVYLKPKYRGMGIGRAFFEMLFSAYGDVLYKLEAEKENHAAISLYEKCGFEVLPYTEMIKNK